MEPFFENEEMDIFKEMPTDAGDEFMAVKPWLGAIKAPTNFKKLPKT